MDRAQMQRRKEIVTGLITLLAILSLSVFSVWAWVDRRSTAQTLFSETDVLLRHFSIEQCTVEIPKYERARESLRKQIGGRGILPWTLKQDALVYHFLVMKMQAVCADGALPPLPETDACDKVVACREKAEIFLLHHHYDQAVAACNHALVIEDDKAMRILKSIIVKTAALPGG